MISPVSPNYPSSALGTRYCSADAMSAPPSLLELEWYGYTNSFFPEINADVPTLHNGLIADGMVTKVRRDLSWDTVDTMLSAIRLPGTGMIGGILLQDPSGFDPPYAPYCASLSKDARINPPNIVQTFDISDIYSDFVDESLFLHKVVYGDRFNPASGGSPQIFRYPGIFNFWAGCTSTLTYWSCFALNRTGPIHGMDPPYPDGSCVWQKPTVAQKSRYRVNFPVSGFVAQCELWAQTLRDDGTWADGWNVPGATLLDGISWGRRRWARNWKYESLISVPANTWQEIELPDPDLDAAFYADGGAFTDGFVGKARLHIFEDPGVWSGRTGFHLG